MKTYHDITGDGGSDVLGQVQALHRAIADALSGVDHLLAIGSGKGGVGKSTVTMALAQSFARRGRRVAILDADFNGPCQARLGGLEDSPWVPGERGLVPPRRSDGIAVVSFGSLLAESSPLAFETVSQGEQQIWRGTREFALLGQLLSAVDWGELDVLLFDLPPGAERTVQYAEYLAPLDAPAGRLTGRLAFVMVTVPSDLARGVVARSLAALEGARGRLLGYVENMAGYFCRECGEVRPLFPEPTVELGAPCLARLPFDPELAELCDRGWPEGAESEAAHRADELADTLWQHLGAEGNAPQETAS
jgi:ATP-binding protein involved in chromosome partitioning